MCELVCGRTFRRMKKVEWNIVRLGHRQKVASFTAWGNLFLCSKSHRDDKNGLEDDQRQLVKLTACFQKKIHSDRFWLNARRRVLSRGWLECGA